MNLFNSIFNVNILKGINNNFVFLNNYFANHFGLGRIPALVNCTINSQTLTNSILSPNTIIKDFINELHTLFWKGKNFKGTFIHSKWRWYHRHGYWATRKKKLKFDTYRRHRYHEVRGPGPRPPSKWEDQSYFKPLRKSIKFW